MGSLFYGNLLDYISQQENRFRVELPGSQGQRERNPPNDGLSLQDL